MDDREIRVFLQLYYDKNMSKAAEHLFLSQQGLSKIIKKMENELGTPLFIRTHYGVEPTQFGETLKEYAHMIIQVYEEIYSAFNKTKHHKRVHVALAIGIIALLSSPSPFIMFSKTYPDIDFIFHEHREPNNERLLINEIADLGCMIFNIDLRRFEKIPILKANGSVFLHKEHPLASKSEICLDDLKNEKLVLCGTPAYYAYVNACRNAGFEPDVVISSADFNMSMLYVQAKFGICPTLTPIKNSDFSDGIVAVPFQANYSWDVCLIIKKGRTLSNASKLFIDFMLGFYKSF